MRRLRRIKILATLGPASSDSAMIRKLFEAGADIFRINMSHTPHDKLRELVATIRSVEASYGRPIGILVDLQGPKLRLGTFADGPVQLNNGQSFVLDADKTPGDATRVHLPHPEILAALQPGHALLLDDGKVRLIAEETSPTRAEVSDVATAVYEGADAIMLSAESAAGKYPIEAVSTMNRIGEEVERDVVYRSVIAAQRPEPESTAGDAIAEAARRIAENLDLPTIICWTSSGSTAVRVARERPKPPVVAITPNLATGRRLSVVWGVHCVVAEDARDQDDMVERAGSIAFRDGFVRAGQRVLVVAGVPLGTPGTTNMVRIAYVGPSSEALL